MKSHVLNDVALKELRHGFTGDIIMPGDPAYDEARTLFNTMIDKRPAVIAKCENIDDIARAIRLGRELELEVAVRCGGHSVAGTALTDGGIVIDLRRMNTVTVDSEARTAIVTGGAIMRDFDQMIQPYGLASTGGRVSTTGVGGLILGGGAGWLDRKFGLMCDNLLAVELVTADGEHLRAADDENPELFWALHGGGGNFGVATSFTFRLHPLQSVTAALLMWDPAAGPDVMRAYRDFMGSAPDDVSGAIKYHTAPPKDWVPENLVGTLACTAARHLRWRRGGGTRRHAPYAQPRPRRRDDCRGPLRRAAVDARRPTRLPQLLVRRVP
jgi:FAD/FMN-containing dehydrogenase